MMHGAVVWEGVEGAERLVEGLLLWFEQMLEGVLEESWAEATGVYV